MTLIFKRYLGGILHHYYWDEDSLKILVFAQVKNGGPKSKSELLLVKIVEKDNLLEFLDELENSLDRTHISTEKPSDRIKRFRRDILLKLMDI